MHKMSKQYAWTSKSKFQNSCLLKCLLKIILGLFNRQFASSFDFVYVYWFPSCYESCKFAYGFDLASVLIPVIAVVFLGPWEGQGFRALYHEIQHVHPKNCFSKRLLTNLVIISKVKQWKCNHLLQLHYVEEVNNMSGLILLTISIGVFNIANEEQMV